MSNQRRHSGRRAAGRRMHSRASIRNENLFGAAVTPALRSNSEHRNGEAILQPISDEIPDSEELERAEGSSADTPARLKKLRKNPPTS